MDAELQEMVSKANGRRKVRIITQLDIEYFEQLFSERKDDPAVRSIRVYPTYAFVPNSYKWRADVTIIQATRDAETGEWHIGASTTDAKRSYGSAARATINGRAI